MKRTGANPRGEDQPKLAGRRPRLASKRPARPWQIPEAAKVQARSLIAVGVGQERVVFAVYGALAGDPTQTLPADALARIKRFVRGLAAEIRPKVASKSAADLVSRTETPAGTEPISKDEFTNAAGITPLSLPESPPKLWPGRQRGRPNAEADNLLISFLEETYGAFLPANKDVLREYIGKHDPRLLQAVRNYERRSVLPSHLEMPSVHDRFAARMATAKAAGYPGFTEAQIARAEAHLAKAARPKGP